MLHIKKLPIAALVIAVVTLSGNLANCEDAPQQKKKGFGRPTIEIPKAGVTPHWFADDSKFWYRNALKGGGKEFIVVDADACKREPAFDHTKLAASLSKAANEAFRADRLPFNDIEFADEGKALRFEAAGKAWKCDLGTYECTAVGNAAKRQAAKEPEPTDGDDLESPEFTEQQPERQPKGNCRNGLAMPRRPTANGSRLSRITTFFCGRPTAAIPFN